MGGPVVTFAVNLPIVQISRFFRLRYHAGKLIANISMQSLIVHLKWLDESRSRQTTRERLAGLGGKHSPDARCVSGNR